jgi:hypothetical protein
MWTIFVPDNELQYKYDPQREIIELQRQVIELQKTMEVITIYTISNVLMGNVYQAFFDSIYKPNNEMAPVDIETLRAFLLETYDEYSKSNQREAHDQGRDYIE